MSILISGRFFLGLAFPLEVRESISSSIYIFLMVLDLEIVLIEPLGLVYLSEAKTFCGYETQKIIMIDDNKDFVSAVF